MAFHRQRQRGMSLVELMVGITIGLFVVAAASIMMAAQLNDNRRLLLETQVQQDLRASADIITRELRRAGYFPRSVNTVSSPTNGTATRNFLLDLPISSGGQQVGYGYIRPDNNQGPYGYKLESGVIKTQLSTASGFQELTDLSTLFVDSLTFTLNASTPVRLSCPNPCPPPLPGGDDSYCWPTLSVRDLTVTIVGHAVSDASISRTVVSRVRLRNDQLVFAAGNPATPDACP